MQAATTQRKRVRHIELCMERFTTILLGTYNGFIIDYVPGTGFRKFNDAWADGIWHRTGKALKPLAEDIMRFKTDMVSAAANEPGIGAYMSRHAELRS